MWRIAYRLLAAAAFVATGIYLINASWLSTPPDHPSIGLIAHRGVHQNFDLAGVTNETCVARRIHLPIVGEIENSLPSMQKAFEAAADVVELDVHPTTDGQFAVFHDWTLDCAANGHGPTRAHSMAYLKTLDIGYGYSADGGRTFPLRGRGIGMMPSLSDVLTAFPRGHFLVNYKSKETREGDLLAAMLRGHPEWRKQIWGVYGGGPPTDRAIALIPGLRGYSMTSIRDCLLLYEALGWIGYMPAACRHTIIPLPINVAEWMWGWPNRFQTRMAAAGSTIVLFGPYHRTDVGTSGIDTKDEFDRIPRNFDGYISTNDIALIAPLAAARRPSPAVPSLR